MLIIPLVEPVPGEVVVADVFVAVVVDAVVVVVVDIVVVVVVGGEQEDPTSTGICSE